MEEGRKRQGERCRCLRSWRGTRRKSRPAALSVSVRPVRCPVLTSGAVLPGAESLLRYGACCTAAPTPLRTAGSIPLSPFAFAMRRPVLT
eukprot:2556767-Rhodomonas_salina.1